MQALAAGEPDGALAGALLAALRAKGETADEIRGFAKAMRVLAVHPAVPEGAPTVDTVGTGGTARAVACQEKGTVKIIIPTTTPNRARPALRNCRVGSDASDPQREITAAASPPQADQVRIVNPMRKCQSPPRLPNPAAPAATAASRAP
jgi:shikimate 5-dehydrogenase